jgi:hypothetical protein
MEEITENILRPLPNSCRSIHWKEVETPSRELLSTLLRDTNRQIADLEIRTKDIKSIGHELNILIKEMDNENIPG